MAAIAAADTAFFSPSHSSPSPLLSLVGALPAPDVAPPAAPHRQLNADIAGATPAVRELNRTTNEFTVTNAPTLLWHRMGGVSMANYSQNLTSLVYDASVHRDASFAWYVPPEPVEQLGVLLLGMVFTTALAWYCMQLRPNDACGFMCAALALFSAGFAYFTWEMRWGQITMWILVGVLFHGGIALRAFRSKGAADARSQPICFPFLPRYWLPRLNTARALGAMRSSKHAAALRRILAAAEAKGDAIDSDVLAETRLVCTMAGTADGVAAAAAAAAAAAVATDAAEQVGAAATAVEEGNGGGGEGGGGGGGDAGQIQLVLIGLKKFFAKEREGGGAGRWRRRLSCACNPCGRRPKIAAVDGVSLTMRFGECFALLGHNGAGKTTTINMVTAQLQPEEGDALVCGASVRFDAGGARRHFGCCPQHDILYPELTAREHLELYGMLKGRGPAELRELIPAMLKQLALAKVGQLSSAHSHHTPVHTPVSYRLPTPFAYRRLSFLTVSDRLLALPLPTASSPFLTPPYPSLPTRR